MADNIKIVGNILSTTTVSRYSNEDINLIPSNRIEEYFGGVNDYIEFYLYDAADNLLITNYNYLNYKLPSNTGLKPGTSTLPNTNNSIPNDNIGVVSTLATPTSSIYPIIEIDPVQDVQSSGYSSGEFKTRYNIFHNILSNPVDKALFIKEISQDRTEVRLGSISLTNNEIESVVLSMIDKIENSSYYVDYLLNFGNNEQYIAINVALNKVSEGYEILLKLYDALPSTIQEKATLWIVEEKTAPYLFDINLDKFVTPPPPPTLRGPNFSIAVPNQGTISTTYTNYQTALLSLQSLQSSSYSQILNLMNTQSIQINVNYAISESSDFNNFVFFSSAYQRTINFYTKVKQIEDYNNLIKKYRPYATTTSSLQNEINQYSASINTIISQFDGYESYLYFESSSYAWPKSGSLKPYILLSTGSTAVNTWYTNLTSSAKIYDLDNYDNLEYAVPNFIRDDENNAPYLVFLNMIGHYFDNIWIYIKAITDINLANNNLNTGISKDLVYNQLQSLGIKLYNSQAGEDLDKFLIGANTGSSIWNNDFSITGSYLNNIPRKDLVSELYKRIYHNLPLLLKTKGTVAGLEYLISTFGIPSQTYYVSGSETIYTPLGSNFTSSILNVKEFGGSLKSGLIKEYNNDKVRIVSNTITGSVLSPILSLQTYPTASSEFRENDMHYLDISFSPQTQIDTYVSRSIASNNPTWNLDNYIGDPRYLSNTSYAELDTQRKLYYQTGVAGFPPFTGSSMDYNGFIRLIQYFDNALFKMLGDFVPERTSLSTGITIGSPVLERNKTPYALPTAYTGSVYEGEINSSSISSEYGTFYNALTGSKKAWYDGDISGSYINTYAYFENSNPNPYLLAQSSSFTDQNIYDFQHSDFNVLFNNVSRGISSLTRQNIEYIGGNFQPTNSITYPAELQDSYLTLQSYNNSRYDGTKLTSLTYNIYTSASYSGSDGIIFPNGDISFGKAAAIDRYVRKIGLFTRIESSSFLPKRNTTALKYLVDEFGGLTELNQRNKHWEDVQRIFLMGTKPNVSLFDNKKYSNQKATDGNKLVFDSGYTYAPILYFATCSLDPYLSFEGTNNEPNAYTTIAKNSLIPNGNISGSSSPHYSISASYIMNLFDYIIEGESYFKTGSATTFPSYSIKETSDYNIFINLPVTWSVTSPPAVSSSWYLQVYKKVSGVETLIAQDLYTWLVGDPDSVDLTYTKFSGTKFTFNLSAPVLSQNITIDGATAEGWASNDCLTPTTPPSSVGQSSTATILASSTFALIGKTGNWETSQVTYYWKPGTGLTINGIFVAWNNYITLASGCKVYARISNAGCTPIGL